HCFVFFFSDSFSCGILFGCFVSVRIFFLMILRPPIPTLFPYTTLFRSYRLHVRLFRFPRRHILFQLKNRSALSTKVDDRLLLLRSEEHTSELQSRENLVCRLLLEKKNIIKKEVINLRHKMSQSGIEVYR